MWKILHSNISKGSEKQYSEQLVVKHLPQLLSTQDVSGAKEGDAGEPQVLMQHEHAYWDEIWVTQVVDKATDVAIVAGVNTINLPILYSKIQT